MTMSADNVRGALSMMAAMAGFATSDAIIKLVASDLPLFQAMCLRGGIAAMLLAFVTWKKGALRYNIARRDGAFLGVRAIGEACGAVCLLIAFTNMPIVNATAIMQVMPLVVTLGAACLFAERVGPERYASILIGFLGVLVVIRPGMEGFSGYALWAVGAVAFFTMRDLATRCLSKDVSSPFTALVTSIIVTVVAAQLSMEAAWEPVSGRDLLLLAIAAGFTLAGYLFSVITMRIGDVSVVAPFRYSILLWALLLGFLLFAEVPDAMTMIGSLLIVIAGFQTLTLRPAPLPQPLKA